jgi:glucokinase
MSKRPKTFIGIEIGGTKLQIAEGDAAGKLIHVHRKVVDRARGGAGIREQIEGVLAKILRTTKVAGVGVGFGGPVNWRTGRICRSHHIEGWSGFDLGNWLKKMTDAPVFVDNDANVAALAEALRGAGRKMNPVFYITLGSGVGGGLIVDGKIYHGATPGEVEIGHVRLDRMGTILESRCSGWAVDARIRALKSRDPSSLLCRLMGEKIGGEAKFLTAALAKNDPAAKSILKEIAEDLGFGLSHVVQLFHPEIIVMGGGLSGVGEPLRAAVAKELKPFVMEVFAPGPRICLAGLGRDVVPVGALELVRLSLKEIQPRMNG